MKNIIEKLKSAKQKTNQFFFDGASFRLETTHFSYVIKSNVPKIKMGIKTETKFAVSQPWSWKLNIIISGTKIEARTVIPRTLKIDCLRTFQSRDTLKHILSIQKTRISHPQQSSITRRKRNNKFSPVNREKIPISRKRIPIFLL